MKTIDAPELGRSSIRQTARDAAPQVAAARPSARQSAALPRILLTDVEAADAVGVSVRKFHELRKLPDWPRAVVLGLRVLRWSRAELEAAVECLPRQAAPGAEPAHLARGREARAKRLQEAA